MELKPNLRNGGVVVNGEPLCVRTFAEVIRGRMSKKAQIKNFDAEKNSFQSDVEVRANNRVSDRVSRFLKL